jgi:plastocyanin
MHLPSSTVRFFLFISFASLLALTLYISHTDQKKHTVTRTDTGMSPRDLLIHRGDIVTFRNASTTTFWPASDSHPTHNIYAAFDSKRPLAQGESWDFTFTKPGIWRFHDHLRGEITGTITVTGNPGEVTTACLETQQDAPLQPECFITDLALSYEKGGFEAIEKTLNELNDTNDRFKNNCHDVMHWVGTKGYAEFQETHDAVASSVTSFCGFGYYHGFSEAMLAEHGPKTYDVAIAYCTALEQKSLSGIGPCLHGIGHAIFDSLPGELWGKPIVMMQAGVDQCKKIMPNGNDNHALKNCASGIFNAYVNALTAGTYSLSFTHETPDTLCTIEQPLRSYCMAEITNGFLRQIPSRYATTEQQVAYILSLPSIKDQQAAFVGYADTESKRKINNKFVLEHMAHICNIGSAKTDKGCILGTIAGIRGQSRINTSDLTAFCKNLKRAAAQAICTTYEAHPLLPVNPEEATL